MKTVREYSELAEAYVDTQPEKALVYAELAKAVATIAARNDYTESFYVEGEHYRG